MYQENRRKIVGHRPCYVLRPPSLAATSPNAGSKAISRAQVTRVTKERAIGLRLGQLSAGGIDR